MAQVLLWYSFVKMIALSLILSTFIPFLAPAQAALVCDRQKIQQALEFAKASPELKELAQRPYTPGGFKSTRRLQKIFRDLELKTFGQRFLHLEGFPAWPGLTLNGNVIQFSSITDASLQQKLKNPDLGAAFEIAHEMGHIIQNIRSPHDLKIGPASSTTPEEAMRIQREKFVFHAETDCIAVVILSQAGYPLTSDISGALSLIAEECAAELSPELCSEADTIRQSAVRTLLPQFTEVKSATTKSLVLRRKRP